jgi:tetratricopeptide (TPR) repeat protein
LQGLPAASLERARRELEAAATLARRFGTTTTRARILNNLGIVHNNLNRLTAARRSYARARKLQERAGDQRGVILTLLNVATIAAKVGDDRAARGALERALGRLPASRTGASGSTRISRAESWRNSWGASSRRGWPSAPPSLPEGR